MKGSLGQFESVVQIGSFGGVVLRLLKEEVVLGIIARGEGDTLIMSTK